MKLHILASAMAAVLGISSTASHADTLLLSDDFTVTAVNTIPPATAVDAVTRINDNLANRQSGTYAGSSWILAGSTGFNVQTGNNGTQYYPGPAVTDGNNLLISHTGVQNNLALNYDLVSDNAITISFDMYLGSSGWGAFSLSNTLGEDGNNAAYPSNSTTLFSFLANRTGGFQEFNASPSQLSYYSTTGAFSSYDSSSWTVVLSDVVDGQAGTGSPFGGNGTYVFVYYNGTLINESELETEFGDLTLYLGFYGQLSGSAIGIDNLSVSAVPEPASIGYLVVVGMGLVALAARRRCVRG